MIIAEWPSFEKKNDRYEDSTTFKLCRHILWKFPRSHGQKRFSAGHKKFPLQKVFVNFFVDFLTRNASIEDVKGEVLTINDRNICERRSCMKNNGKSPTFKFVSGEERRPSEVQRISRDWRLPWRHSLVSGSHLDPKMTENSGSGAVRARKRRAWAWELLFRLR